MTDDGLLLHATCVAVEGRGVLICGPSGAGKSALGLQLMALGARLVADDQVALSRRDGALWAACPPTIRGMIEARGVGLLNADPVEGAEVVLAVDLGRVLGARVIAASASAAKRSTTGGRVIRYPIASTATSCWPAPTTCA